MYSITPASFPGEADVILPPVIDLKVEQKKYEQTMKYFDFVALMAHGMGIIMVCLNAIISYRVHRHEYKLLSKLIHGLLHLCAIGFGGFGVAAMIRSKSLQGAYHLVSYHAWIGVLLICFYIVQFIAGFVNYAFPKTSLKVRAGFLPWHTKFGVFLMTLAVIQVSIGHKYVTIGPCENSLSCSNHLDFIHNFAVLSIIVYYILILVLVGKPEWKRRQTIDERKHE
uniref:Cytochrome b561 domain-containing protein n=1 Tax=Panagrolaimus sp. ES5 TaxID=591445 RepID=A0AC34FI47_9BILA